MSAKAAATPGKILAFGHHSLACDMTVVEFLAGMALARGGALTSTAIAREVSIWLGKELRVAELRPALLGLVQHQWARAEAGSYTLSEDGVEALAARHLLPEHHVMRGGVGKGCPTAAPSRTTPFRSRHGTALGR